ncbi:MAG: hypothetical protein JWO06_3552, partial [Bacteroidota bacterium]|nr:hypothetical protein [Bacteroidota bacterium]
VDPTLRSYVDQRLALLKNNESDMNKQVFGLLVMNRFIPQSSSTSNAIANSNYISGTAANTVSEFVSSQLSNYLSNLLEFANIRNLDINIGFRQYDQSTLTSTTATSSQSTLDTRRELNLALTQRLLNNRLSINAGGNLDFGTSTVALDQYGTPIPQTGTKAVIPTGDFQIEYALTPNGVWKAKAFNRTNYDYLNYRNTNKTGVGISYRQEFDKPSELVEKRKANKKKHEENKEEKKEEKQNNIGTPPTVPKAN